MSSRNWMKTLPGLISQLNADDIVVFLVGPSGSRKSSFVGGVTKSGLEIGTNLRPATANVHAIRCELMEEARNALGGVAQKHIVFVDTPSFHTGRDDDAAESEMKAWLGKSRCQSTLIGVIYMHGIETDPYESIQLHLDTFASTFPQDFTRLPQRLHVVLSHGGEFPEDMIQTRRAMFQEQLGLLHPSLAGRLRWVTSSHPDLLKWGDSETAWQAVVALFPPAEAPPAIDTLSSQTNASQQPPPDTGHSSTAQINEERSAAVSIEESEREDSVIAVMGPMGSGKTTFIRIANGLDTQREGQTLKSSTKHVQAVRFWDQENDRHVVLVDTPGFDDTSESDPEIPDTISNWLNSSYKKGKLLSGILYLHRITDNRMAGTPLKNLQAFQKLCGKDALDKVWLITTMWDEVDPTVGGRRLTELEEEYWKTMIEQGAQVARCRKDDDSPRQIIQQILDRETGTREIILLQEELVNLKKGFEETEAEQELYSRFEKLVGRQMGLLQRINNGRKTTLGASLPAELQTDDDNLRAQTDSMLRQMQELKLSPFKALVGISMHQ